VIAGVVFAIKELRLGALFVDACGVVVPAFLSFKAIESPYVSRFLSHPPVPVQRLISCRDPDDDRQWLSYWVVFGILSLVDNIDGILTIIPFYYLIKAGFVLWLWLPMTSGALTLYRTFVQPFFKSHEAQIDAAAKNVTKAASAQIAQAKQKAAAVASQVEGATAGVKQRVAAARG